MSIFEAQEYLRYSRHIQLPQVGAKGQIALKNSRIVIIGCGGLGAPVSLYLAAAGVGTIILVDGDHVELTNLQRQITFTEEDIGKSKAKQTQKRLKANNQHIDIKAINSHLNTDNAVDILNGADVVVDCTDNFTARYLINDTCKALNIPWVYASIHQFSGQLACFSPDSTCFRCVFPKPPSQAADCNTAGVIGVLPGILGTLQANEVIKLLLNLPGSLINKLLLAEPSDMSFQTIQLQQDPDCVICSGKQVTQSIADTAICATSRIDEEIDYLQAMQWSKDKPATLVDVRSDTERLAFHLGGLHIPLENIESWLEEEKSIEGEFIFYCQSGARSLQACLQAKKKGLKAYSLQGGLVEALKR